MPDFSSLFTLAAFCQAALSVLALSLSAWVLGALSGFALAAAKRGPGEVARAAGIRGAGLLWLIVLPVTLRATLSAVAREYAGVLTAGGAICFRPALGCGRACTATRVDHEYDFLRAEPAAGTAAKPMADAIRARSSGRGVQGHTNAGRYWPHPGVGDRRHRGCAGALGPGSADGPRQGPVGRYP